MPNFDKKKRNNKSKKEIVSDIQLVTDADRRRSLIKDIVFPYLTGMGESIDYSKLFLHSFGVMVNTVYDRQGRTTTIGSIADDMMDRLGEIFDIKDKDQAIEHGRYSKMVEMLRDVSVQDFAYAVELSRYIDGYILKSKGKDRIDSIPLDDIMGK